MKKEVTKFIKDTKVNKDIVAGIMIICILIYQVKHQKQMI